MHIYPKACPSCISYLCDSLITHNSLRFPGQKHGGLLYLILLPQTLSSYIPKYLSNVSPFSFTSKLVQAADYSNSLQIVLFFSFWCACNPSSEMVFLSQSSSHSQPLHVMNFKCSFYLQIKFKPFHDQRGMTK